MSRTRHIYIYSSDFISNRYIMHISQLSIMHVILSVGGCQRSAKLICWQPNRKNRNIYIYIKKDMTLSLIDMDFPYQFNLRLIAPLFTVFFQRLKKKVLKFFKSWQVCGWLAKWFIMLGFMDLRQPRVYRRSNVGLVLMMLNYDIET